jgi:hypothetical protein
MQSFSPKSATERPPCPKCGASMLLTRIVPKKLGINQRPYECVIVFRSLQVSFRQAGPPQLAASLRHDVSCCRQSEHFDTESCSPMDIGWVGCPR